MVCTRDSASWTLATFFFFFFMYSCSPSTTKIGRTASRATKLILHPSKRYSFLSIHACSWIGRKFPIPGDDAVWMLLLLYVSPASPCSHPRRQQVIHKLHALSPEMESSETESSLPLPVDAQKLRKKHETWELDGGSTQSLSQTWQTWQMFSSYDPSNTRITFTQSYSCRLADADVSCEFDFTLGLKV